MNLQQRIIRSKMELLELGNVSLRPVRQLVTVEIATIVLRISTKREERKHLGSVSEITL
jgi:hypothetical protein